MPETTTTTYHISIQCEVKCAHLGNIRIFTRFFSFQFSDLTSLAN